MIEVVRVGAVRQVASTVLPTKSGVFQMLGFERQAHDTRPDVETAVVLIHGNVTGEIPILRIHSQCFTGDVLGSLRCDCRDQLELAMQTICRNRCGLLIYEHQEGRGIGLIAKLQAYALQDDGYDTITANHALGFDADYRDFSFPVALLDHLGIRRVRHLSNNPDKLRALVNAGIDVVEQIPCEIAPTAHTFLYLRTKKERMGHTLRLI